MNLELLMNVGESYAMKNANPKIKEVSKYVSKNSKILDIGCGYGEMSKYFIDNGAKLVVAIDISEKMIQKAMKENVA